MISINKIYKLLLNNYGKQFWWPILNVNTSVSRYSGNDSDSENECFEISIGAILTQSVSWKNVEKALINLKLNSLLKPEILYTTPVDKIALLIKSSGYYNEKAKKIKNFLNWFGDYQFSFKILKTQKKSKIRNELLSINGIGPETADSIILYALLKKVFVVDEYARRIFTRFGILSGNESYGEIQKIFHSKFSGNLNDFKEYHALIVAHGKDICKYSIKSGKHPLCLHCILNNYCYKII